MTRRIPKLEINTNKKTAKIPAEECTDRRVEILYFLSEDLNLLPGAACAARKYGPREWLPKQMLMTRLIERHISSAEPHWSPLDPSLADKLNLNQ